MLCAYEGSQGTFTALEGASARSSSLEHLGTAHSRNPKAHSQDINNVSIIHHWTPTVGGYIVGSQQTFEGLGQRWLTSSQEIQ